MLRTGADTQERGRRRDESLEANKRQQVSEMNYFVFHTYMVGSYSSGEDDAWEENIRIYLEESSELALVRATDDAYSDQVEYETSDGGRLTWRVHEVRLVRELTVPGLDGAEVFSRSLVSSEAQSLIEKIS
jgi:hypothetical protein